MQLDNFCFSKNKFKVYSNIILHYTGDELYSYYNKITDILTNCIIKFYEEKIINRLINYNYFYFDSHENKILKLNAKQFLDTSDILETNSKKEKIWIPLSDYILNNNSIILDGFVNFRLANYVAYLDNIVDLAVNKFIIDREYLEFINLLKLYINSKESSIDLLHLIYTDNECIILDNQKNVISPVENRFNARYLSDITFSCNDYALNTLLTLLPKKLYIHLISEIDEFIETLTTIFADKVYVCNDCNLCRTYHLIHSNITKND